MGKLTAKSVENAKPGRHSDGDGLHLLVKPTGARSWVLRVQVSGRRRDIGLGAVETTALSQRTQIGEDVPLEQRHSLTLAEARELSSRLRNVAKAGRDPAAERKRDRSPPPSFKEAAKQAHAAISGTWVARTSAAFLASLEQHAYPVIGNKQVDEITANDVASVVGILWTTKPVAARKLRQRIAKVLDYSKAKGWRESEAPRASVATLLGKPLPGGNFPAMPYADVPAYFRQLGAATETSGRLALMLAIATAARSGEVRQTRWGHIDWDGRNWNRPAEIMKGEAGNRKPHTVTLNDAAMEVLRRAANLTNSQDPKALIFAAGKGKPLSDMTLSKVMRDGGLKFVPHGFRSSFRDWAAEKCPLIPDPVAEAALAHAVPDAVVKAYKRAKFIQMRRELLAGWSDFLGGLESNVIPLDQKRA